MKRLLLAALAALGLALPGTVAAQSTLSAPRDVVIYVHQDLNDDDFVELLICELTGVLAPPVRSQSLAMPITPDMMASANQLLSDRVAMRLYPLAARDGDSRTFKFLILPYDLRGGQYAYLFGSAFGAPHNSGVLSTARLLEGISRQAAVMAADRTYKMIVRYVAQLSGLTKSEGCVMAMPRSLNELDGKSREFCEPDREALVAAGILKSRPGGDTCLPTS